MTTTKDSYDCIVIGGGPSGMMAAGIAAKNGARVLLLEKNKVFGQKLTKTGGGRCNITNAEFDTKKFLENFPKSKQFLYSPFSQFSVQNTFSFFEKLGLPLVVEARKRAFPKSQSATDVRDTLLAFTKKYNVEVVTNVTAKRFVTEAGKIIAVETNIGKLHAKNFILATGGIGGDLHKGTHNIGFEMLAHIGHTIHKPNPNLVPLKTSAKWVHRLSGVTLSFMTLRFHQNQKVFLKKTGKILFTHFGISGPLVINASTEVLDKLKNGPVRATIDCFPDTNHADLDKRIRKLFDQNKNKQIKNVLSEIVPKKLSDAVLFFIDEHFGNVKVHSVFKEERKKIVHILKELAFPITGSMGLSWSIVADGGVDLTEIDFKTMSSRLYPNLHITGDVLNINRPSGGYSLQLCWTTGYVAGTHAAKNTQTQS